MGLRANAALHPEKRLPAASVHAKVGRYNRAFFESQTIVRGAF
jgi:hypothetical protein